MLRVFPNLIYCFQSPYFGIANTKEVRHITDKYTPGLSYSFICKRDKSISPESGIEGVLPCWCWHWVFETKINEFMFAKHSNITIRQIQVLYPAMSYLIGIAGEVATFAHSIDVIETTGYRIPCIALRAIGVLNPFYACSVNVSLPFPL